MIIVPIGLAAAKAMGVSPADGADGSITVASDRRDYNTMATPVNLMVMSWAAISSDVYWKLSLADAGPVLQPRRHVLELPRTILAVLTGAALGLGRPGSQGAALIRRQPACPTATRASACLCGSTSAHTFRSGCGSDHRPGRSPSSAESMFSTRLICSTTGMVPPAADHHCLQPYSCSQAGARACMPTAESVSISIPGPCPVMPARS